MAYFSTSAQGSLSSYSIIAARSSEASNLSFIAQANERGVLSATELSALLEVLRTINC